ncbi:TATA box-binding 1 [Solea senegalensis]|uniref:TATA box-binding 1 n=1 Tax=Solea senegalensis TaxID=28829 RepID=A0AAV6RB85_SOLSE|nr:TATA box-binding 1 [Solea senegalensis]
MDPSNNNTSNNDNDASNDNNITIANVVSTFKTGCHLDLHTIALRGRNVIHQPKGGKVVMKLRKPLITATISSSGGVVCAGAKSEAEAKMGARRVARCLQKLGFKVTFSGFRVVNVLAVSSVPFRINLIRFTMENKPFATYEPELFPAAIYKIKNPKATLQVYSTGAIVVTGPNVKDLNKGFEHTYPRLFECQIPSDEPPENIKTVVKCQRRRKRTDAESEMKRDGGGKGKKRGRELMQHYGCQPDPEWLIRTMGSDLPPNPAVRYFHQHGSLQRSGWTIKL